MYYYAYCIIAGKVSNNISGCPVKPLTGHPLKIIKSNSRDNSLLWGVGSHIQALSSYKGAQRE